ncbi:Major facilitator, sugar transporter-like [Trema orientale]|uniref:Major facilitator, sugar transporter-like n=1 Tax=Trema orientale TaxID=63057 RepID=A0A2P5EJ11_TREOI|nr:Major facilitator, sugar transporter-like [Trema orientale]
MDMEEGEAEKSPLLVKEIEFDNNGKGSTDASSSSSSVTSAVIFSTFVVYCGAFALGNVVGYTSPAESGIVNELGLTLEEYSTFVSTSILGSIFGTIWSGKLADFVGRRRAIAVSALFCIMGWLAIAFAKGPLCLDVGRFSVGCGVGLVSYAAPVYISEITPKNLRGTFMSLSVLLLSCGKALFFFIGSLLNWRTLALIGIVPFLLQLLGLLVIPESPRWLTKIGKAEESKKALKHIRGEKTDISQELAEIMDYTRYSDRISENGVLSLFHRKYTNCLIIGLGLMVFPQFGGLSALGSYTSSILESIGFSSTIGSIAVGITEDLHCGEELTPFLALSGVLVSFGFINLGLEGIPWIISLEIFPINIKGAAGSFLTVASLISGWINSYTFNFIFEWSSAGTFFIFAGVTGAVVLFSWRMVPETKGRSLEELQASSITHDHSPQ